MKNGPSEELKPLIDALEAYLAGSLSASDQTKNGDESKLGEMDTKSKKQHKTVPTLIGHLKEASNIRILLAEDNVKHLERATRWLNRYGYEHIVEARSAKEAQEILQQQHFDVIIADMRMEADDSGFTIIEEVKTRNITSMVIVLTANDTVDESHVFGAGGL